MPDVSSYNGIDVGDIASINGQDIASGGAGSYDPVTDVGTYTETVPTSGLIKYGGAHFHSASFGTSDTILRFAVGRTVVNNISSDKDGAHPVVAESKSDFTHISYGRYAAFGITSSGQLWEAGHHASYMEGSTTIDFQQITGIGDSNTGWTSVSCSYDGVLAINSGKMYYLGSNGYGHAGTGDTTSSYSTFTQVGSDSDWQKVVRTRFWSMATKTASDVLYTCGRNQYYQTGQDTSSGNTTSWTAINSDNFTNTGITHFTADYDGGFLIRNGEAYGWGAEDTNERFGLNASTDVQKPTAIGFVGGSVATDWAGGALGSGQSLLINTTGELFFAGEAGLGHRGDGSTTDVKDGDYIQMGADTDWERVEFDTSSSASATYVCIKQKGGKLYFTGYSYRGHIIDAVDNTYSTETVINSSALAAGNVWTTGLNNGSSNATFVAAIY
jgi:alpha-tubulin suppressor-like RCC1 family protein